MARLPRLYLPGLPQHVIQRGNNQSLIMRDDDDAARLIDALREAARAYGVAIHAYVVMPNHFHLLATPSDEKSLSRALQAIGRRYVSGFNRRHARSGTLWEGRFRSTVIEPERYLLPCMRYIETNPLRSGIVADAAGWKHSSYHSHVGTRHDPLVSDHSLYWSLGNTPFERQAAYKALFDEGLAMTDVEAISNATQFGWVLGAPEFIASMGRSTERRLKQAARGRPKKTVPI